MISATMRSDETVTPNTAESMVNSLTPGSARLKVALVCDFLEEKWPSMDLFGDMLFECFQAGHPAEIEAALLRPALHARFSKLPLPGGSRLFGNADRLLNRFGDYPRWLKKRAYAFDLFHIVDHSYSQLALELPAERTVVTCHDLDTFRCLLEPERDSRPGWFRRMTQRILDGFLRCGHVVTPSESTRAQILRYRLFPEDRVTVIYPGVDPIFFEPPDNAGDERRAILAGAGNGAYLLHVGSTIPRKRIDILLRVVAAVVAEIPNARLVRVGMPFTPEHIELVNQLNLSGNIVQATNLSKASLASVYRNAAILLQPSEAEGFGLPVIEALACGCPVIASDIAPLREAGGCATEYCPVADVKAWSEAVLRLLREREAAPDCWEVRKANARRHASQFTWPENANRTLEIYRSVLSSSKGARPAFV